MRNLFLFMALFGALIVSSPAFAEPFTKISKKETVPVMVILAAGLSSLQGPVEYRPARDKEMLQQPQPPRQSYEIKADNKDLYSGSLLLATAKP